MGTGHHFVWEQLCPWASPGQRLPITQLCQIGFLSRKTLRGGPPSPLFFLSAVAFFLMFLMILQRSPNDGDESAGPALLAGPHVLLWPPAAPLAPGTVTP